MSVGAQVALLLIASTAVADDTYIFTERWRELPMTAELKPVEEQHALDNLNDLGNFLGSHVNTLSHDYLALKFDGRRNRARLRLGTGDGQLLRFNVDSNWLFMQDRARMSSRVELGIGKHQFRFELPDIDMATNDVYGQLAVEVRLPVFERRW